MTHMVLVYVEDPGAANMLAGFPPAMAPHPLTIWAEGQATETLKTLGIAWGRPSADLPDCAGLLVGTSENPKTRGFDLIAQAREKSVPTLGLIDGPSHAGHRFRGLTSDPLAHAPDWLFVPDMGLKVSFEGLGFDGSRIKVVGHPALDRARAFPKTIEDRDALKRRLFTDADENPVVLFLSELSDGLDPSQFRRTSSYLLMGRGGSDERTHIVLEEVLDAISSLPDRPYVALRHHPKEAADCYDAYRSEIDTVTTVGSALDAIYAADLVIGLTTILLFEAAAMGRPVLSVTPRKSEEAWLSAIGMGVVTAVHSRTEIAAALQSWQTTPESLINDQGMIEFGAPERLAKSVLEIISP